MVLKKYRYLMADIFNVTKILDSIRFQYTDSIF